MIRAIYRNGAIHPLDPLPEGWPEGQELQIVEAEPGRHPQDVDQAFQEIAALAAKLDDPDEWAELESALADADRMSKALMRREMGLE